MPKNVKSDTKKIKKTSKASSAKQKKLNDEIKSLNDSLKKSEDKYVRLMAEFENFKKRNNKALIDSHQKSLEKIISSFLPILDDMQRIINDKNNSDIDVLNDGILMVEAKFIKILSTYNIQKFDSVGKEFDPDLHEAIMSQNSKEKENIILEEFEKGYKIEEKIIRHSKVIVSKGS
ncbi:MAG: nucleotide exchange factor GrpE [Candidatus Marinimicrobia bacterium]|nr:nucleotide exchange factor GrpE [Candidatus Neomarinimicrobiota bacterium]|tara:strand:- start:7795 stop:8322 length:528 start_codon:yes stop_codon:yes gene_type:complete